MKVQPLTHLSDSVAVFRRHPIITMAIGLSMVLSVAALCCGLGVVTLPWFGCELYAFQIATGTGARVTRKRAWFSAGLFILASATLVVIAAAISSLGVDLEGEDAIADARRLGLSVGGVMLAMVFLVPFTYAPRILIDRGGTIGAAALESARFFVRDGVMGHLGLVLLAHFVQSAPLVTASVIALALADASAVPFLLLGAVPFLAVTVPIGQGVITAAWVARRDRLTDADKRRPAGRAPLALAGLLAFAWIAPGLSLALTIGALVRPSTLVVVDADAPGELLVETADPTSRSPIAIRDTALTVEIDGSRAAIVASDGGGVGALPLRTDGAIEAVRVTRDRDAFAIDLTADGVRQRVTVDRSGVRQDDSLEVRFDERLPAWGLFVLALALLLTPLVLTPAVVDVAEVRASATLSTDALSDADLLRMRSRVIRRTAISVLVLSPTSLGALMAALLAHIS
jgi:hypothetical protein